MRVVGYVRESADPTQGRSGFAQQEELRRHAAASGHILVAVCQDLRTPGEPTTRDGYLALLGIVAAGRVDAVLVAGLGAFSSDQVVQEIILWDLRQRGLPVLSTDPADHALLDEHDDPGPTRMVIRDVLARVGEHVRTLGKNRPIIRDELLDADVLVHIIHADQAEVRVT